jgi:SAM-dependent methyltransferase
MNACPLCRAVQRVTLVRGTRSGDVHRCVSCGFVYSDPRGAPDPGAPPAVVDDPAAYLANARDRLAVVARETGVSRGRLLDVGCYDGAFLLAAQTLGFAGRGVELDPLGAARARERGLDVLEGKFETAAFDAPFDVVTFIHSLEHFADPLAALVRAREWLVPAGALLVEVPNFGAWSRPLLGRRWRQFIADHDHFFEPFTLRRCLEDAGFVVRRLAPVGKSLSVRLLADRLGRYYHPRAGRALAQWAGRHGLADRRIRLNFGDILLAVAQSPPSRILGVATPAARV